MGEKAIKIITLCNGAKQLHKGDYERACACVIISTLHRILEAL